MHRLIELVTLQPKRPCQDADSRSIFERRASECDADEMAARIISLRLEASFAHPILLRRGVAEFVQCPLTHKTL
jgi:hypothetical protein